MTTQFAIPTFQRADACKERTLATLLRSGVHPDRITLFTGTHDTTLPEYDALASATGIGHVPLPEPGIGATRYLISSHYPAGTRVVMLDDDVRDFLILNQGKLDPIPDIDDFTRYAFDVTEGAGRYLWGTAPVANPFFMGPKIRDGLSFCIGTCLGFISRPGHPVHTNTVREKEDYETSLLAWWFDGGIIRFDDIVAKADHYKLPGGYVSQRTTRAAQEAVDTLTQLWPGLITPNRKRKSGYAEIRLRTMPPGIPHTELPPTYTA